MERHQFLWTLSRCVSTGPLTYENKSKLPKYEISESLKHTSDSAASDTLSQRTDDLEEDEHVEVKNEGKEDKRQDEEGSCSESDCQEEGDKGK